MSKVEIGFLTKTLSVPLDKMLPNRRMTESLSLSPKYQQIKASIAEIDLIEPLSITAVDKSTGMHMLLDGHVRRLALQELGYKEAPCLVATDDESYTYNNRVNRLSTIQEHLMIKRAIERGVSQERLARALHLEPANIKRKLNLLDGICPEAADLLKDRRFSLDITVALRKMKPTRQVECIELMTSANCLTAPYAKSLLAVTQPDLLVSPQRRTRNTEVVQDQLQLMDREMKALQNQYKIVEANYGDSMLHLMLAQTYLGKLLANELVNRYLRVNQPEVLEHFQSIVAATSAAA